jgi:hypothetical protein
VAHDIDAVVGPDGWATWESLTARVDRKTLARWVGTGRLRRIQPGVYALPVVADDWRMRVEAAVRACDGVVSHSTALALWELIPPGGPVPSPSTTAAAAGGRRASYSIGPVSSRTRSGGWTGFR